MARRTERRRRTAAAGKLGRTARFALGLVALAPATVAAQDIGGVRVEDPFANRPRIVLADPAVEPPAAERPAAVQPPAESPAAHRMQTPLLVPAPLPAPPRQVRRLSPAEALGLEIERRVLERIDEALFDDGRPRRRLRRHDDDDRDEEYDEDDYDEYEDYAEDDDDDEDD